jgi:hypothetical protein
VQQTGNGLSDTALDMAYRAYKALAHPGQIDEKEVEGFLDAALEAGRPSAFPKPTVPRRKIEPGSLASVVINNYNYGRFLHEAIDSALSQTYTPLEVVVVDDGSTDESREVIASYGDRVIPVIKDNGGQASAFNAGFAASRGDVVVFIDADDVLLPTAVERAMEVFEPGVVKVHWPLWEIDIGGTRNGRVQPESPLEEGDLRDKTILEGPIAGNSSPTSGNAWSRDLLERLLPAPEQDFRISADGYLLMLAWLYGEVRTIPEPLSLYRIHGQNLYASYSAEERLARHLAKYSHHCDALETHLRAMGGVPNQEAWKRWKGIFDPLAVAAATEQLANLIPPDETFILVDEDAWADPTGADAFGSRKIPFLERDGVYWGKPADDAEAIAELERLRIAGAGFIAFAWSSFWWLEYYTKFSALLQQFTCILSNDRLLVFDLRI